MEAVRVQLTIDCADPAALARFWSAALRYSVQFEDPTNAFGSVVDPAGAGPRLVFQRVPEPKAGKNRAHLDLQVGQDAVAAELGRLTSLGASVVRNLARAAAGGAFCDARALDDVSPVGWRRFILADPEGNEFCLQ